MPDRNSATDPGVHFALAGESFSNLNSARGMAEIVN